MPKMKPSVTAHTLLRTVSLFLLVTAVIGAIPNISGELAGEYLNLDYYGMEYPHFPQNVMCPNNVSIGSVKTDGDNYMIDYENDLQINGSACMVSPNGLKQLTLVPMPFGPPPLGDKKDNRSYTWVGNITENTVKCSPDQSGEYFPNITLMVLGIKNFYSDFHANSSDHASSPSSPMGENEEGKNSSLEHGYYLAAVVGGGEGLCFFFKKEIYDDLQEKMKEIRDGKHSGSNYDGKKRGHYDDDLGLRDEKFKRLCKCAESFPDYVDVSEEEEESANKTEASHAPEASEEYYESDWRPPRVRFPGGRCPIDYSRKIDTLVSGNYSTHHSKRPRGKKDLVYRAVINKMFAELRGEYPGPMQNVSFDAREKLISEMPGTFLRRRVLSIKKGAKCGPRQVKDESVLLIEKKHILMQLQHDPILQKLNKTKVMAILSAEVDKRESLTLHILRNNTRGSFDVCTYTNSTKTIELLKTSCDSFKPLGSQVFKESSDEDEMGSGTNPPSQEGPGEGTEGVPVGSTGNPTPGSGSPSGSGAQDEKKTASPTPSVTASRTPSPSPESPSPSPTASPAAPASGSGACFPGQARIELSDGSMVRMDELQVGDAIRDGSGQFSKVILFAHSNHHVFSEFVHIMTKSADIVLSPQHYIPANGKMMTAENVKKGDKITTMKGDVIEKQNVEKIERVRMWGLFNPQTISGSVVVTMNGDAVVASTYTASLRHDVAHAFLAPLRFLGEQIGVLLPFWSGLLRDGSAFWASVLPSGSAHVELI